MPSWVTATEITNWLHVGNLMWKWLYGTTLLFHHFLVKNYAIGGKFKLYNQRIGSLRKGITLYIKIEAKTYKLHRLEQMYGQ